MVIWFFLEACVIILEAFEIGNSLRDTRNKLLSKH